MGNEIKLNKKLENKYNFTSNVYDILDFTFENFRYKKLRKILWNDAKGRILDVGIGTGRNIAFYPKDSEVFGIDISDGMIKKAEKRAKKAKSSVKIQKMDVLDTNFPDNYFDTIVSTFMFCVMPDELQPKALKELKRICKNKGKIIILEYEYSKNKLKRFFMKLFSPYVEFLYGARFDRKTLDYIKKEDFKILKNEFIYKDIIKVIVIKPKISKIET